mgnify:CR=1 FL=1
MEKPNTRYGMTKHMPPRFKTLLARGIWLATGFGFIWAPTFTAFWVLFFALFNSVRIAVAFLKSRLDIAFDFSMMLAGESVALCMTLAFTLFAELDLLESFVSGENQMRMRVIMGAASAFTTHRFYIKHHK